MYEAQQGQAAELLLTEFSLSGLAEGCYINRLNNNRERFRTERIGTPRPT